jgi:hypothetical protein
MNVVHRSAETFGELSRAAHVEATTNERGHRWTRINTDSDLYLRSSVAYFLRKKTMEGIQFVVNEKGDRKAVVIDLEKHGQLWEDFYDTLLAKSRADEPRESLAAVKELLQQSGKL